MQLPSNSSIHLARISKLRHGQKIHKLSIHGAFTCPNRDGTLGRGGCTFCNVSSFADESAQQLPWCSNCWHAGTR